MPKKAAPKSALKVAPKAKKPGLKKAPAMVDTDKRYETVDADHALTLTITQLHVDRAICKDGGQCVIAQALFDHFGPHVDGFSVGSNITKIYNGTRCVRYSTPSKLAKSLRLYDETKHWSLPPGQYTLLPLAKSYRRGARWDKIKHSGGKQDKFRGTVKAPTRHAMTVCQIRAAAIKSAA